MTPGGELSHLANSPSSRAVAVWQANKDDAIYIDNLAAYPPCGATCISRPLTKSCLSQVRPATTSASAGNILQPISINKHHNRTNTTYSTYLPQRSLSIMDRGRPVRKSSASCWPGVGRELGTKPAEEWKRDKEGRTSSVADLHFR